MSVMELHFTKKDFRLEWFSGTGPGGQHRNKHQNCCRIIHKESGLRAQSTEGRDRPTNQRLAFGRLARLLISHFAVEDKHTDVREFPVIRNYHGGRNEVLDKASGLRLAYRRVVEDGDIGPMIEARAKAERVEQSCPEK